MLTDTLTPASLAHSHFDRLMVRVLMPLFAAGALAVGLLWWLETSEGKISEVNRWAYPVMLLVFGGCLAALRRQPRSVRVVRWVGFLSVAVSQLSDLALHLLQSGPLIGNYNAMTLITWLPLVYAVAFFMLEGGHAVWSACIVLALVSAGFTWRLSSPAGHADDITLLVNVLASHAVFIVCLSGWLRMKQLLSRQQGVTQELRVLAATDELTGLSNRRHALERLERLLQRLPGDHPPVALLCDVDHFKRVNDELGHDVGDRVLSEVAEILRRATRASDTVSRWGGEEFLIVLPATPLAEAGEMAERLRLRVATLSSAGAAQNCGGITISLGLAAHQPGEALAAWLRRADQALYRAKAAGRDRCEVG
ncbi:MAG: GGDEF domain-containing protein [Vitreoscilla sp.]|nr:GGDEF domain-containing protein [Vitreoscilla sp.]